MSLDSLYIEWNRMTHGIEPEERTPWYLLPIALWERQVLRRAPLTVAWTEKVAEDVRRAAPTARVETLHPGLDLTQFRPRSAGTTAPAGPRRVLFVGGRWEAKGGPDLVRALEPVLGETVQLDVVSTDVVPKLPGVSVHSGSPASNEVLDLFAKADVFCLPTKVDACPWVVLEAMASGVPVVSTRVGSIPEMVGAGGVLVEPGDIHGLREALTSLLQDPDRRRALGKAGRARTEATFDARKNAPTLLRLLRAVATEGQQPQVRRA